MSGAMPGSNQHEYARDGQDPYRLEGVPAGTATATGRNVADSYFAPAPLPERQREPVAAEQRESFLVQQPAGQLDPSADHNSQYGDWMAPAAAGVAGAGLGVAAVGAYEHQKQDVAVPPTDELPPEVPEKSERRSSIPSDENVVAFGTTSTATNAQTATDGHVDTATPMATVTPTAADSLGGMEREGAHETGAIFPKVVRHDTEMSVSQLHVPGEYPKQT